jgi:Dynein heavy chain AAA lid domain
MHPKSDKPEVWVKYLNAIFGFSMIWACGAHFKFTCTRALDNIFRDFFGRLLIPTLDSVFEYYLDEATAKFIHWQQIVPQF